MTDRPAASTREDLAGRLATLEMSLDRERDRRRRLERVLLGGVLFAAPRRGGRVQRDAL